MTMIEAWVTSPIFSIQGTITGAGSITDYEAQEGGRLKNFNSGDADSISAGDFNQQATNL